MRKAKIIGTGMAVPECVVDNHLLARCMNTSDEWIVQRTGIRERRVSPDTYRMLLRLAEAPDKIAFMNEVFAQGLDGKIDSSLTVSDLAFEASQMALKNAGVTIGEIDCIVDSSTIPDFAYPHTGCVLQGKFGLTRTPAFNLQQGTILEGLAGEIYGSSTYPVVSKKKLDEDRARPRMNGRQVFVHAVRRFREVIGECLEANQLTVSDVDLFIFHQANIRIIEAVADALKIPIEKTFNNVDRYGNTAAASVPICLHEARVTGRIKEGDLILLAAFGTGFSWGASLLRW